MTWNIIADSSCDITSLDTGSADIAFSIVPLKIIVGEREYVDNETLDVNEMLSYMKHYKGPSSSACPSPEEWATQFKRSDYSIAITLTSGISGTYNSARVGMEMVLEEFPEKKIFLIDTKAAAGNLTLVAKKALELIQSGLSFEEVSREAKKYSDGLRVLFSLQTFDNLIKTGRMSKFTGLLASSLGIRAVAGNTPEGTIQVLGKPRGELGAIKYIVKEMEKLKNVTGLPVIISHCNNLNAATLLKDLIEKTLHSAEILLLQTRGLTSFYAGEAGLIVSF